MPILVAVTIYHVAYELWLYTNYTQCGGAIPYPWYYDIQLSARPGTGLSNHGSRPS